MKKRFKNIKGVPGPDGIITPRVSLNVNKNNEIANSFWAKRFREGALELIVEPKITKTTKAKGEE